MRRARDDARFLTVVTYGRTGSTALQAMLNSLPGVVVRGENYGALRGLHDYVQALAETADRHHAGNPAHPWYGSARLDPDAVVTSLREHVLSTVLRPPHGTRWIGFKEVRYEPGHFPDYDALLQYLLFLDVLFPGIVFLVNVRDPQEVARSGWWPDHGDARAVLGTTRDRLVRAVGDLSEVFGPDRVALLDYSQWSEDPLVLGAELERVGLPRDDDALRRAWQTRLDHGARGARA